MKNKIILVSGDPNSINSELVFKSWKNLKYNLRKKIILIGNYDLIQKQKQKLKFKINLFKINSIDDDTKNRGLKILDLPLRFKYCFNVPRKEASKYVINCLNYAHSLCKKRKINAFIKQKIDRILAAILAWYPTITSTGKTISITIAG